MRAQKTSTQPLGAVELALAVALGAGSLGTPAALAQPFAERAGADLAVVDARLIASPGAAPRDGVTVVLRDGRVESIGRAAPPEGMQLLDAGGRIVTAGFWNSHVHLTDPRVPTEPQTVLRDMLLRYGFTSVVDTGSDPAVTLPVLQKIASGELDGPRILLAGGSFVGRDGTPAYLPGIQLPELHEPAEAARAVHAVLEFAQGIKIFSGSFQGPSLTIHLAQDVVQAVAEAAHAKGAFVIAHPTDRLGLENAVRGGVDVLAHTAPPAGPLGDLVQEMLERKTALVPTLKLWRWELARNQVPEEGIRQSQQAGVAQVRELAAAGGEVLFGTDVGYMNDWSTTEELELLSEAGLSPHQILAALTTAPARRFAEDSGRVEVGAPGDLVLLHRDPTDDPAAFSEVFATVRNGRVVFRSDDR